MEGLQKQAAHCHDKPSTKDLGQAQLHSVLGWNFLSLSESEETVTESIVTMVLIVSISGALFFIWVRFNMMKSCHPGISLLYPLLWGNTCLLCHIFLFFIYCPVLVMPMFEQGGIRVNIWNCLICKCIYSAFLNGNTVKVYSIVGWKLFFFRNLKVFFNSLWSLKSFSFLILFMWPIVFSLKACRIFFFSPLS